jgi:hypothetical protein
MFEFGAIQDLKAQLCEANNPQKWLLREPMFVHSGLWDSSIVPTPLTSATFLLLVSSVYKVRHC